MLVVSISAGNFVLSLANIPLPFSTDTTNRMFLFNGLVLSDQLKTAEEEISDRMSQVRLLRRD